MAVLVPLLAVATAGVALLLLLVSLLAASRTRSTRFLFAGLAFGLFALRSITFIGDQQGWWASPLGANGWTIGADALTLALLYLAIVKG